jgi:hypothetical protein
MNPRTNLGDRILPQIKRLCARVLRWLTRFKYTLWKGFLDGEGEYAVEGLLSGNGVASGVTLITAACLADVPDHTLAPGFLELP